MLDRIIAFSLRNRILVAVVALAIAAVRVLDDRQRCRSTCCPT